MTDINVVLTKIEGLKELIEERFDRNDSEHKALKETQDGLKDYQKEANGQIAKNTAFRNRGTVYVAIGAFIIPIVISIIVSNV